MKKQNVCRACGKIFYTENYHRVFCSPECRKSMNTGQPVDIVRKAKKEMRELTHDMRIKYNFIKYQLSILKKDAEMLSDSRNQKRYEEIKKETIKKEINPLFKEIKEEYVNKFVPATKKLKQEEREILTKYFVFCIKDEEEETIDEILKKWKKMED